MDPESKAVERKEGGQPVPVCVVPYTGGESEISLVDLWRIIAARKHIVLLSLLAAVALATVYLFVTEPVYRAEANLLPPQQQDVQALAVNYHGNTELTIERYTPDFVYQAFLKNLRSKGLRREFFDANELAAHYLADSSSTDASMDRVFDKRFNGNLRAQENNNNASLVVVSFSDSDPMTAARWLNGFIDFSNRRTVRQLLNGVNAAIQAERDRVRYQLESKLKLAAQRRQDRILSLREALSVARALGIESAGGFPVVSKNDIASIEVNTAQTPLYMHGVKALEAEITVLDSRKSDEPFVQGLRDLQEKLAFLEGISIERDKVSAVTIDSAGRAPYRMERPNKNLIFVLTVAFGLLIGVFLVFLVESFSKSEIKSD